MIAIKGDLLITTLSLLSTLCTFEEIKEYLEYKKNPENITNDKMNKVVLTLVTLVETLGKSIDNKEDLKFLQIFDSKISILFTILIDAFKEYTTTNDDDNTTMFYIFCSEFFKVKLNYIYELSLDTSENPTSIIHRMLESK
jgi:hypothetical protein